MWGRGRDIAYRKPAGERYRHPEYADTKVEKSRVADASLFVIVGGEAGERRQFAMGTRESKPRVRVGCLPVIPASGR